ncbi:MAG TPA: hypothetical protein VMV47_03905 [Bacteroidales bacterium]|nr:hypothetical protein [Bacteroidales bacterium]
MSWSGFILYVTPPGRIANCGIEVKDILAKHKPKGTEVNEVTSMKTIADKPGITPRDVYVMLTEE